MKHNKRGIGCAIKIITVLAFLLIPTISLNADEHQAIEQNKVYVVMSNTAKAYHSNLKCKGLKNATHPIKQVSIEEAQKMGRKPCKICYGH